MPSLSSVKKSHFILSGLLILQIIGLQILKLYPEFVERYYSLGLYPVLSKTSRYLFGWIPFSVGDLFYLLIGIFAIRWIVKNFKGWKKKPLSLLFEIFATISIVYFMFHILWGLNYYRLPLHQTLDIKNNYTYEELLETTKKFIEHSNMLHNQLTNADSVAVSIPYSQKELYKLTKNGYDNLQREFPNLQYDPLSIKTSLWSTLLTYMGYSGYLNPFSGEAQVNGLIHFYQFPVIACHEEAHQIGFAAENEANFIAILSTLKNDDMYFQYAGSIFSLRYLLNEIGKQNREDFQKLKEEIAPGIFKNYKESTDFWNSYDNPFDKIFLTFFDQFLKASNQSKGVQSYSYVVALLVNYDLNFDE